MKSLASEYCKIVSIHAASVTFGLKFGLRSDGDLIRDARTCAEIKIPGGFCLYYLALVELSIKRFLFRTLNIFRVFVNAESNDFPTREGG